MTNVDQFESVFRSAAKEIYVPRPIEVRNVLCLHDLDAERYPAFERAMLRFLGVLGPGIQMTPLAAGDVTDLEALLQATLRAEPDLICTYRGLLSEGWRHPFSLGERLDVVTQATPFPVLVVPHPGNEKAWAGGPPELDRVMAITDHLATEAGMIDWAHRFTKIEGGMLLLAHVEDEYTFERYIDAISKVPTIDTDVARETLHAQLLKEPSDYIDSCRKALQAQGEHIDVRGVVNMGQRLGDIRGLISEHEVDLLVMNTKNEDQLAMHGLAYPLAVELREVAILML